MSSSINAYLIFLDFISGLRDGGKKLLSISFVSLSSNAFCFFSCLRNFHFLFMFSSCEMDCRPCRSGLIRPKAVAGISGRYLDISRGLRPGHDRN